MEKLIFREEYKREIKRGRDKMKEEDDRGRK